jgi:hypothetical protein
MLLVLLGAAGSLSAADPAPAPAPRPRLTDDLRRQAVELHPAAAAPGLGLVVGKSAGNTDSLAPYHIVDSSHGMIGRDDGPPPGSRPFTLREGGTYREHDGEFATTELMLQGDPPNRGWDFLRITW